MSHESWVTTSSASTMELAPKPPTGLLLRDSARGEKSRSWAKRLSTFSKRPGRQGTSVPAAVDLRAARGPTANIYAPFDEPDEAIRSPARQEQPMPVLPEADEDDYWRAGLKAWFAGQAPSTEHGHLAEHPANLSAKTSAPVTPPVPQPSACTPPPISLGIALPRGVHFAMPTYPTYREETTAHPRFPVYTDRATSWATSSIHEAYPEPSHAQSQQHDSIPRPFPPEKELDPRAWRTQAPPSIPPHQPHTNRPSAASTTPSPVDFEKTLPVPPAHPATGANAIPITAPRPLTDLEKAHIRGFPSPGASPAAAAAAPRSTVRITARSRAWQTRLHRRHRRRVAIVSLAVLAVVCMLTGVIAALVVSGNEGVQQSSWGVETEFGHGV